MKKLYKLLGIAALVATIGLVSAGCKMDGDGDGDDDDDDTHTTSGKLTITGIAACNDKFAIAYTFGEEEVFLGAGSYGGDALQISNGQVELPVYKNENDKIISYSGNNTVAMVIEIFLSRDAINEEPIASGFAYVTFSKGTGIVAHPVIPDGTSKPERLSLSATAIEAYVKLNQIIAYPGTPYSTKESARTYKSDWVTYGWSWNAISVSAISSINRWIAAIPGPRGIKLRIRGIVPSYTQRFPVGNAGMSGYDAKLAGGGRQEKPLAMYPLDGEHKKLCLGA
jgi:hypothetical protein